MIPFLGIASNVAEPLIKLIDSLHNHEPIIDSKLLKLYMTEPDQGSPILQTGHFVYFQDPQENELHITPNLRVVDAQGNEFDGCSYVVYSIKLEESVQPETELDQKVATLLSQINNGNPSTTKSTLDFLKETVKAYVQVKELKRKSELKGKIAENITLKPNEEDLLKRLKSSENIKDLNMS